MSKTTEKKPVSNAKPLSAEEEALVKRLLSEKEKTIAKKEQILQEKEEKETAECSFQPQIKRKNVNREGQPFERHMEWKTKKDVKLEETKAKIEEEKQKDLLFSPVLNTDKTKKIIEEKLAENEKDVYTRLKTKDFYKDIIKQPEDPGKKPNPKRKPDINEYTFAPKIAKTSNKERLLKIFDAPKLIPKKKKRSLTQEKKDKIKQKELKNLETQDKIVLKINKIAMQKFVKEFEKAAKEIDENDENLNSFSLENYLKLLEKMQFLPKPKEKKSDKKEKKTKNPFDEKRVKRNKVKKLKELNKLAENEFEFLSDGLETIDKNNLLVFLLAVMGLSTKKEMFKRSRSLEENKKKEKKEEKLGNFSGGKLEVNVQVVHQRFIALYSHRIGSFQSEEISKEVYSFKPEISEETKKLAENKRNLPENNKKINVIEYCYYRQEKLNQWLKETREKKNENENIGWKKNGENEEFKKLQGFVTSPYKSGDRKNELYQLAAIKNAKNNVNQKEKNLTVTHEEAVECTFQPQILDYNKVKMELVSPKKTQQKIGGLEKTIERLKKARIQEEIKTALMNSPSTYNKNIEKKLTDLMKNNKEINSESFFLTTPKKQKNNPELDKKQFFSKSTFFTPGKIKVMLTTPKKNINLPPSSPKRSERRKSIKKTRTNSYNFIAQHSQKNKISFLNSIKKEMEDKNKTETAQEEKKEEIKQNPEVNPVVNEA